MRRWATIAAFGLFLAVPLWAQHGGGHSGGGHGGGFSGHSGFSGGHASGGHISGGMRGGAGISHGFSHSSRTGFSSRGSRNRGPTISNFGFNRFGFNRGRRFGLRGWGYGYPGWGYYDPYWWWDSGSNYDEDYERDLDRADRMNQQSLEEQRMMRQEEAAGDQDIYARPSHTHDSPDRAEQPGAPIMPATVLVFRDQHKKEIQNYAIVGQTLWNFSSQHTEKIPLADLDLQATTKANEDQGVTFRVPASGEAQ
jgi:hypothetical protein